MGLDGVELVMELEGQYGIELPDSNISKVQTLGDLYELVLDGIGIAGAGSEDEHYRMCREQVLRHIEEDFESILGIDRKSLSPECSLEKLFLTRDRRRLWRKLQKESTLRYPNLEFSESVQSLHGCGWGFYLFAALWIAALLIAPTRELLWSVWESVHIVVALLMIGVLFVLFMILLKKVVHLCCFPFKVVFPTSFGSTLSTVDDLASAMFWWNRKRIREEIEELYPEKVEAERAKIVARQKERETALPPLRAAFMQELATVLEQPIEQISPYEKAAPLFAGKTGKGRLRRLYAQTELVLPKLTYTARSRTAICFLTIMATSGFILFCIMMGILKDPDNTAEPKDWRLLSISLGFLLPLPGFLLLRKFWIGKKFPDTIVTVKDLANEVARRSRHRATQEDKEEQTSENSTPSNKEESNRIWESFRQIVATQLGVKEKDLTMETDLIELLD